MIRELVLDLGWVERHTDHPHFLPLDEIEIDLGADLEFFDEIGVLVGQGVDHRMERLDYVGVSLLTVVGEETFDYLVE